MRVRDLLNRLLLAVASVIALCAGPAACAAEEASPAVPVLMYHKISANPAEEPNQTLVPLDRFREQMKYLAENGYNPVSMQELAAYLRGEQKLPQKPVVLTFDDGWLSVLDALPVLEQHRFKATFFIVTGYLEGNYPAFLRWGDLQRIAANPAFEIGAHSITHPWDAGNNLVAWTEGRTPGKSIRDAEAEIVQPKLLLEQKLSRPVRVYSWPSGWYNGKLVEIARQTGYVALATTAEGLNRPGDDPLAVKRYPVDGGFNLDQFKQLLTRDFEDSRKSLLDTQPPGPKPFSVPVLMYHRVNDKQEPSDTAVPLFRFKEQMQHLKDKGYRTVSLDELAQFMKGKRELPKKSVVITFDDGWKDMLDVAPVLKQHGFKASFLIITGAADGVFGPEYLSWDDIAKLAKNPNFDFVSHSVTHPWDPEENLLTWLEPRRREKGGLARVMVELKSSKAALEGRLKRPVKIFGWPKGWYNPELMQLAKDAGYEMLLTIREMPNYKQGSVWEVNRYFVHGDWDTATFARLLEKAT